MKISVFGSGYVGLVQAAVLAEVGHDVLCMDIDRNKVERLAQGLASIYEPGLDALLREGLMDDSVKGTRQRFKLSRENDVWTIRAVKEDFSCWRGRKGWGVKLCP